MIENPKYLTIAQAAKYLGVHHQTVRNWIRTRILKGYRLHPKGRIFLRLDDINNAIEMGLIE